MSSNRDWVNQTLGDPDEATPASSMPTITTGKILALALPSLGALIAEPLFTIIDSTMVGHLGTPQLAGLGVDGVAQLPGRILHQRDLLHTDISSSV